MNKIIGHWTSDALFRKAQLIFYLSTHQMEYQRGSMQKKEDNHCRLWEYSTAIELSGIMEQPQDTKVLDVGGVGCLMDFYLAYRGYSVTAIDQLKENVDLANENNRNLGYNITNKRLDIRTTPFKEEFDIAYCINVFEHVSEHSRKDISSFNPGNDTYWQAGYKQSAHEIEQEKLFLQGCVNALKPGGLLVLSYDYKNNGIYKCQPRCAYLRSPEDVLERIVKVAGLNPVGDMDFDYFEDNTLSPPASTGLLVLRK